MAGSLGEFTHVAQRPVAHQSAAVEAQASDRTNVLTGLPNNYVEWYRGLFINSETPGTITLSPSPQPSPARGEGADNRSKWGHFGHAGRPDMREVSTHPNPLAPDKEVSPHQGRG